MSNFRIIGDHAVQELLTSLTATEITKLQTVIEDALCRFSTTQEKTYQPEPGVINRPEGQKVLFRAFTSPSAVGTKIIVDPAADPESGKKPPLHGVLVVCDNAGIPVGLMNAEELTAFRTALSAIVPFTWRKRVERIVVFGAGKQALWHIRLALALRGGDVRSVTMVNRSIERAEALVEKVRGEGRVEGVEIRCCKGADEAGLAEADVVFCTVPSQEVLFSVKALELDLRDSMPYIAAIGSWQPQMIELDPALLQEVAIRRKARVVADDRGSFETHTGEGVQSGLKGKEQVVELGEVLEQWRDEGRKVGLKWCLEEGLLVYKSVGVSLTDLAVGEAILDMARERDVGASISDL